MKNISFGAKKYDEFEIKTHGNRNNPDYRFITIRRLDIFSKRLCRSNVPDEKVKNFVVCFLDELQQDIERLKSIL